MKVRTGFIFFKSKITHTTPTNERKKGSKEARKQEGKKGVRYTKNRETDKYSVELNYESKTTKGEGE